MYIKYIANMNNWTLGSSKINLYKRKKFLLYTKIKKEKTWGWILLSGNVYYLSSHKYKISDTMDLRNEPVKKTQNFLWRETDIWGQSRSQIVFLLLSCSMPLWMVFSLSNLQISYLWKELIVTSSWGNCDE